MSHVSHSTGNTDGTLPVSAPAGAAAARNGPWRLIRRLLVSLVGGTVLLVGLIMIVAPGPAVVVIPMGLGILATEFLWARRLLHKVKDGGLRLLGPSLWERFIATAWRPLLAAMVAVVACFLGGIGYSTWRLASIRRETAAIHANAAPALDALTRARTELVRLGLYVNEYFGALATGAQPTRPVEIKDARTRLGQLLQTYQAYPAFPGERQLMAQVTRRLGALDGALDRTLRLAEQGDRAAARTLLYGEFTDAVRDFDQDLLRIVQLNLAEVEWSSREIDRIHARSQWLALGLGGFGTLVAAAMTFAAHRALSDRQRLLAQHNQMLEARAHELEVFAGRVAHDLKTPLATLSLYLSQARRHTEAESGLGPFFERSDRQVLRMTELIDGLLDFARAGAQPPAGARAALDEALDGVLVESQPQAEHEGVTLELQRLAGSAVVACTSGALTSVLSNLVRNAIHYVGEGTRKPPKVWIRTEVRGDHVRIEVEDTGPGLPPGSEQTVFEPFVRLAGTRRPGTGLGLATVKRVVEAYGGSVGVRSTPGEGCLFWCELPAAPAAPAAPVAPSIEEGTEAPAPPAPQG
ncbi:MAG TPA: ATP-binding protein [Polyangia bacterium]|jgi:signal transduction histidine kinase|nr:ATP-binding protein [Polyangia bacterium]